MGSVLKVYGECMGSVWGVYGDYIRGTTYTRVLSIPEVSDKYGKTTGESSGKQIPRM